MSGSAEKTGFLAPRPARSAYIAEKYLQYGLPNAPSLKQLEPITLRHLESSESRRLIEAIELVFGRGFDSANQKDARLLISLMMDSDANKRFARLLLALALEE